MGGLSFTLLLNPIYWVLGIVYLISPWQLFYGKSTDEDFVSEIWLTDVIRSGKWDELDFIDDWSLWSQIFFPFVVALVVANFVFILINILAIWHRRLDNTKIPSQFA